MSSKTTFTNPGAHPGEFLNKELEARGLSRSDLARALNVPPNRITGILDGKRAITADSALRLARFFGTAPEKWMNLQAAYEIRLAQAEIGKEIEKTVPKSK